MGLYIHRRNQATIQLETITMTNDQLETIGIRNDSYKAGYGIKIIYEVLVTYSAEQLTAVSPSLVQVANMHARANGLRLLAVVPKDDPWRGVDI